MAKVMIVGSYAESLLNFRGPLLREMALNDHKVLACAPDASLRIRNKLSELGVEYRHVYINRTGINPIQDIKTFFHLREVILSYKPDLFLGYTIKPVIYGSLAACSVGVPNIYSMITGLGYAFVGDGFKRWILGVWTKVLYRFALKRNKKVFFQNPDDRSLFLTSKLVESEKKTFVVNGSGVDIDFFTPSPSPCNISFLLIARLIREKGILEYIEAARSIKEKYPDISFRLAGWRDSAPSAISEVDIQGWQDEGIVEYLGKLNDVRPAIAGASVYVLPSYREGTPRTVLEAMAMGRPVITTDTPGCKETVKDGLNGFLVPVKSIESLVLAMEKFINEPDLISSMGKLSRIVAEEKYDVNKVNNILLKEMDLLRIQHT